MRPNSSHFSPGSKISDNQLGFTLVELLVVSVLLAVMASILYATLTGILRGRNLIESQRDSSGIALSVIEGMTRDLTARVLATPLREDSKKDGTGSSSGGSLSGLGGQRKFFLGLNEQDLDSDTDVLRFVTNNRPALTSSKYPNYGLVEVVYLLEKMERDELDENYLGKNAFRLIREESPADVQNEDLVKLRTNRIAIAEYIAGVNYRYMKNGVWEKDWKNPTSPVPEAVEIAVSIYNSDGEIELFKTAVAISKRSKQR